jgi:hypothetical protein
MVAQGAAAEEAIMATVRIFGQDLSDLTRRTEAARGDAPARLPENPGHLLRHLLLIFALTAGVSLLSLVGLLFYGAILGF